MLQPVGCDIAPSLLFPVISETTKKPDIAINRNIRFSRDWFLMGGQGIEPWTHGLRVRCSAS